MRPYSAFTVMELLVVMAVIALLAALILGTSGYVQKKGARSRAEAEIAAISAALESYKADIGNYVRGPSAATTVATITISANVTDGLNAQSAGDPTSASYVQSSLYLYTQLTGDTAGARAGAGRSYMQFKPNQLYPADTKQAVQYIRDPFGYSYGYSTANQANASNGYNPTYDLWSTAGNVSTNTPADATQWIKNW